MLLVEDSENDALLILRELHRSGYETEHERVETAGAMRDALTSSSWDVIFSDFRMPHFGATKALELAREMEPETPFIVVSGRIGEDVAVETMRAGAYDYVMKDNLARLCPTVERGLDEAEERRERRRTEEELRRRDAILDAVRFASDQFLGEAAGWEESVRAVLWRLGEAAKASRVYIFENFADEDGEVWATQRYEWVAAGVPAQIDNPVLKAIPYRAAGFGRWVQALGRGDPVYGHVRDFPESEQPELRAQGILSIALVPIFVEGRWWGVIGFDECFKVRYWSAGVVGALGAAAGTLGAAIRRRQMEERLRAGEERYRAVIEQATDGIYLLDSDTRRFVETNPSFQKMVGYTADELGDMEIYRIVDHPRENVDATIQRTLEQRRRVVGNRKYRRKDGAVLDVEVGVSVISPDGRNVICTIVRDVTERKRNEEALRASEAELRALFEAMTDLIFVIDGEGRHLKVAPTNPALLYRPISQIVGKTLHEIFPTEQADEFLGHVQRVLRTRQSLDFEYSLMMDRGEMWFEGTVSPMLEDSVVWVGRDITERKQSEAALARSESRLRTIIETEPECVKVLGMDGSLLEMNPAGLSMIEADSLEQVRGKSVYDYIVPEYRGAFVSLTERVLRGGSGTLEFEFVGLKGTRRWLDTHAVPLRDAGGGISGLLAITRDITERKLAEAALRENERLYRTVIEQATENIFLIDVESRRIVESNASFRESLGYSEDELNNMTIYDVVAADRVSIDANIRRVLEQGNPSVGERKYVRKDGTHLDVEVSANVILRDDKRTLVSVAHDVTERARMQALLEERVATLSRIAADLVLDLPMEDILNALAASVVSASTAVSCLIVLIDEEADEIRLAGSHGVPGGYEAAAQAAYEKAGAASPVREAIRTHRPVLFSNARRSAPANPHLAALHGFNPRVPWDTAYVVPLLSRGKALGAINFAYPPGQGPVEEEKVFFGAVADQAAVAVENARLFSEARGKAALEERQKLARELHDSVSQALYGITLGVETAREVLPDNPERAAEPLDYAVTLAEAGMTEMRALIFELRPESLEKEGLVAALEKAAAGVQARHDIRVETALGEEPDAPLEAKESLYRIAQEALHNTVKHARAANVTIKLVRDLEGITLQVSDDGVGFDANCDFPGHLGLKSMRERVSRQSGTLEIASGPGKGVRILARVPSG